MKSRFEILVQADGISTGGAILKSAVPDFLLIDSKLGPGFLRPAPKLYGS